MTTAARRTGPLCPESAVSGRRLSLDQRHSTLPTPRHQFVHDGSAIWLLVGISVIIGIPQGLNSLGNQNAMYYQADPARMGASAGLLRTFLAASVLDRSLGSLTD